MQRVPISEEQASAKEDAEEGGGPEVGRCSCLHVWLLSLARARTLGVWARTCNVSVCLCGVCGLIVVSFLEKPRFCWCCGALLCVIVNSVLCQGDRCVNQHFQYKFVCLVVSSSKKEEEERLGVGGWGWGSCGASVCDSEFSSVSVPWVSEPGFAVCVWFNLDCCQETQLCCCSAPVWDLEFSSVSGRWVCESGFCNVSVCAFGLLPK